jgi:iron complex outermembrane receptor protein
LNATDAEANAGLISGLDRWEAETLYVDLSSTYHISDNWDASLNVQNLTEESSVKYIHWEDFRSNYAAFERRITLGINAKF